MLTDQQIDNAKKETIYPFAPHNQHNDCIRICYEWLDAQVKTKNAQTFIHDWKFLIRPWAKRYVSKTDIMVAALLHPDVFGKFPYYNISKRYTEPSIGRLYEIPEAFKHMDYEIRTNDRNCYKFYEKAGSRFPVTERK